MFWQSFKIDIYLFVKAMCAVQLLNTWPTLFHSFMADQAQPVVIILCKTVTVTLKKGLQKM